jgi:phage shock protein PspC (stress-responsive transcriptional regulator)
MSDKKLVRSMDDRMLFGVASGLAHYLNVDPVLVRLFFVLLTLSNGFGLVIYLVLAVLMPVDRPVAKANGFDDEEIVIQDAA